MLRTTLASVMSALLVALALSSVTTIASGNIVRRDACNGPHCVFTTQAPQVVEPQGPFVVDNAAVAISANTDPHSAGQTVDTAGGQYPFPISQRGFWGDAGQWISDQLGIDDPANDEVPQVVSDASTGDIIDAADTAGQIVADGFDTVTDTAEELVSDGVDTVGGALSDLTDIVVPDGIMLTAPQANAAPVTATGVMGIAAAVAASVAALL